MVEGRTAAGRTSQEVVLGARLERVGPIRRVRRAASRLLGLGKTLELAGNLLEDFPLVLEDFDDLPEHQKEAVSVTVQKAAHSRVEFGREPFQSLASHEADALRADVLQESLRYPTSYLPDALGIRYASLTGDQKQKLAQLRHTFLDRLAPMVADATDRMTTALHLARREGFWDEYQTVRHLALLGQR